MKLRNNIHITNADGIVFNAESGDNFIVNKTGSLIVSLLQAQKKEDEIIRSLAENYKIDKATAKADLIDFCSLLKLYDLVENE
ncbi:MAG: PqqD family protein [Paludibacteraceae bacterium]|nr:PqqD family protein [Paludibacteraceae bacterium]MCR5570391.1 PqqD family protein [Paludibacteraceae bacterium]